MKVKAIISFADKNTPQTTISAGTVLDWSDKDRIKDCVSRGLIEVIEEVKDQAEKTTVKKTAKKSTKEK